MPAKNSSTPRQSALKNINTSKIGQGGYFTEGSYASPHQTGIKGQLAHIKHLGRMGETKNLSRADLDKFSKLIGDRLRSHSTASKVTMSRIDKRDIMEKAETMVRAGQISREDKADLNNILKAMQEQDRAKVFNRPSATTTANTPSAAPMATNLNNSAVNLAPNVFQAAKKENKIKPTTPVTPPIPVTNSTIAQNKKPVPVEPLTISEPDDMVI